MTMMKSINKYVLLFLLCFAFASVNAQYQIKPEKGYTLQIGYMVDMLEDLKDRITAMTRDLDQEETDYLFDDKANSIGALIMHVVALYRRINAKMLQKITACTGIFRQDQVYFLQDTYGPMSNILEVSNRCRDDVKHCISRIIIKIKNRKLHQKLSERSYSQYPVYD